MILRRLAALAPFVCAVAAAQAPELALHAAPELGAGAFEGSLSVPENPGRPQGRRIELHVVVLEALDDDAAPDPVFFLAGGPGQAATAHASWLGKSWMRKRRDIVLVDQRGTGRSNPLRVALDGNDADIQGYLEPMFAPGPFRRARETLSRTADLTQYTTPIAMDDLDAVRRALGYERINLVGGSYGTRAALVYLRRHTEHARAAILIGVAGIAFRNPLYHAAAAQSGFDVLCEECRRPEYRETFGDLATWLDEILERLEHEPATVEVRHPRTGEPVTVTLSRDAFAEALRVMMYYMPTNRRVPLLLRGAHRGDYRPFAETAIQSNRGIRDQLALGMLMSVVGSEDIPRIEDDEIGPLTENTFLGAARVRAQRSIAAFWPRGEIDESYGEPVAVDVPVLLISGKFDPVTTPRWGEEAASHLPNGLHIVTPEAHGSWHPRVAQLQAEFLEAGSIEDLDTTFLESLAPAALEMPKPVRRRY